MINCKKRGRLNRMDTLNYLKQSIGAFFVSVGLSFVLKLVGALVIVVLGFRLINALIRHFGKRYPKNIDKSAGTFIMSFLSIMLKVVTIATAAALIGVPMTAMVTVIGSAGLAVGLALQGSLANFAGGVIILAFKPFTAGDYIEVGSKAGTVDSISIFYTTLITIDNRKIVIPNGEISNNALENYSAMSRRRIDLEFSASYESDTAAVKALLLKTAAENKLIHSEPAPFSGILRQEDSGVIYALRVWCASGDYWNIYFDLQERVKAAFDREGISIPYPHMHIVNS